MVEARRGSAPGLTTLLSTTIKEADLAAARPSSQYAMIRECFSARRRQLTRPSQPATPSWTPPTTAATPDYNILPRPDHQTRPTAAAPPDPTTRSRAPRRRLRRHALRDTTAGERNRLARRHRPENLIKDGRDRTASQHRSIDYNGLVHERGSYAAAARVTQT